MKQAIFAVAFTACAWPLLAQQASIVDPYKPHLVDMYDHKFTEEQCAWFRLQFPGEWWQRTPCDPNPNTRGRVVWEDPAHPLSHEDCLRLVAVGAYKAVACEPPPPPASPDRSTPVGYLQGVMLDAGNCRKDGGTTMGCYVDASPKRCKQAAVDFIGKPDFGRRTWVLCVQSCASASLLSRTVGDCRR